MAPNFYHSHAASFEQMMADQAKSEHLGELRSGMRDMTLSQEERAAAEATFLSLHPAPLVPQSVIDQLIRMVKA